MYRNLVLSGGSVKGIAYIGCIKYLEEIGRINEFKNLIGSSVGAIVCFTICCGLPSSEITSIVKSMFHDYQKKLPNIDNIINVFNTMGIEDGNFIVDSLSAIMFKKFGTHDMTFMDLVKKTGKNLVICGSNLTTSKTEFFNVDNTPNMSVLKALRISISIPIIFTPVMHDGAVYADAALFSNFPIEYFEGSLPQNTLGIHIRCQKEGYDTSHMNIVKYVSCLIDAYFFKMNDIKSDVHNNNKIVEISIHTDAKYDFDFKKFKFNINATTIDNYIQLGFESIKQSFDQ